MFGGGVVFSIFSLAFKNLSYVAYACDFICSSKLYVYFGDIKYCVM